MTFDDYLDECARITADRNPERFGPIYFEVLAARCPDIAALISGSKFDPRTGDDVVPVFLEEMLRVLDQGAATERREVLMRKVLGVSVITGSR